MGRLRFLTAGESHGPALAATLEGVPAGLPLTADRIALDLARRQRGYGRGARSTSIEQDRAEILAGVRHGFTIGSPILLLIRNRDWENWTRVMAVEPLTDEQAAELAAARRGGRQARRSDHAAAGRARGPGRGHEIRLRRRPKRPGASLGARDCGPGRGGSGCAGAARQPGHRRVVAHRRGRRSGDGPRARHSHARGSGGEPAALPRPRGGEAHGGPHRRGARGRRHGRRHLRGRGPGRPDGPRQPRPLGSAPGRSPGRRRHEHPDRQGRGVRPWLRADAPASGRRSRT